MTLSEAKSRSHSVINTLRSLRVPDVEILARLVKNMGFTEAFVRNQLALLPPPVKSNVFKSKHRTARKNPFKAGSLQAHVFESAGINLFDRSYMRQLREKLKADGYSTQQVNSAFGAVRYKVREMKL